VLACARDPATPALEAAATLGNVAVHALDVTDPVAITALARQLAGTPIDVLLNVAGSMGSRSFASDGLEIQRFGAIDYDDWLRILQVNLLGQVRVAEAFAGHVAASEQRKIVTLSSMLGSMGLNTRGGLYAYRSSKAAVNAVMKSMAVDLQPQGIIAIPMHPGWVRTDMGGANATLDPADSVAGMRRVIAGLTLADSGRLLQYDGAELPW
jgi:NAD(P)-dependent dehydrogenase (short-subunit alcohol dehydrogenase family)